MVLTAQGQISIVVSIHWKSLSPDWPLRVCVYTKCDLTQRAGGRISCREMMRLCRLRAVNAKYQLQNVKKTRWDYGFSFKRSRTWILGAWIFGASRQRKKWEHVIYTRAMKTKKKNTHFCCGPCSSSRKLPWYMFSSSENMKENQLN